MKEKDNKLVITPLRGSKGVSQVLSNDTCRDILDTVSDEPLPASQIADKLCIPLPTIDYNLKKLADVGLIKIHHKRWSQKGRKMNFYAPANKFIIIVPRLVNNEALKTLKKLLPIGSLVTLAGGVTGFFLWSKLRPVPSVEMGIAPEAISGGVRAAEGMSQVSAGGITGYHLSITTYPILFFLLLILAIATVLVSGYLLYKKYWRLRK